MRGIVLGPSGYAGEGREWLSAFEQAGLQPSLEGASFGNDDAPLTRQETVLVRDCGRRIRTPGGITFHLMPVPHWTPDRTAEANVLRTMFETYGLPPGWRTAMQQADRVIVPTEWGRQSFLAAGVPAEKLAVLPPPLDVTPFPAPEPRKRNTPMRWLSIGEWTRRKGFDVLVAAFARAFRFGDAELYLKTTPRGPSLETMQAFCDEIVARHQRGRPPRVQVLSATLDAQKIGILYAAADAFVLASRGEGWGRPVHEAMLRGLPVVATGAGALATLLPDASVGWPVQAKLVPVDGDAARETAWFEGMHWHEPDLDDLTTQLATVANKREEARARAERAWQHVVRLCARERVMAEFAQLVAPLTPTAPAARARAR